MAPKHPFITIPWDARSDQPDRIKSRADRRRLRRGAWFDYGRSAASALLGLPCWLTAYALAGSRPAIPLHSARHHIGIAVSPSTEPAALDEAIAACGAGLLQVRCPVWSGPAQDDALALIDRHPAADWLVVVPQDRRSICAPGLFAAALAELLPRFPPTVTTVQLGNASNRLKWGAAHIGEYLRLLEYAMPVLRDHPAVQVAGSSVIDFEPLATWRSLVNHAAIRLDICSALLYVDRRGPPEAKQYGLFDTTRKLRTIAAALRCSRRCRHRLWITEVNWPLAGHGADAPTSPKEAVDEATAAAYLERYLRSVLATGLAERTYVWQLAAKGYGLVDPTDWRRRPAFDVVRNLVAAS